MTRQRAQYLRRATSQRRCPRCRLRAIVPARIDATPLGGPTDYITGRTVCRRCGFDATAFPWLAQPRR